MPSPAAPQNDAQPDAQHRPLRWVDDQLLELDQAGLRRRLEVRSASQAAVTQVDGQRMVNFSANDYLGLAADQRVVEAAIRATRDGWGAGASPLVTGRSEWHARLEKKLAQLEGVEAALLFPTGFAANLGAIPALVGEGDLLLADAKNHASLIDGCRLARAERRVYRHNDADALARLLEETAGFRRRLIVTDSLFSMDGDLAPLDRIAQLALEHDAMLMVDEAHATGVWGPNGRGAVEHFSQQHPHVEQAATIRTGTLSKALGSLGGFVCGSRSLIDWLANSARSYVFSTAAPAATAAAALAALEIVEQQPNRRTELLARATRLRAALQAEGWDTGQSTSQIVPILIGDPERTMRLAAGLGEAGFRVPGIRPPSVPEGESLLRVSLCHGHTDDDIAQLVATLGRLRG